MDLNLQKIIPESDISIIFGDFPPKIKHAFYWRKGATALTTGPT